MARSILAYAVMVDENYPAAHTVNLMPERSIERFVEGYSEALGRPVEWPELQAKGFRVVRVRIQVVEPEPGAPADG